MGANYFARNINSSYSNNLNNTINENKSNTIALKLTYFIDFNQIKNNLF